MNSQLRTLVEAGVSQEDLQQINVQLANLMLNVSTTSQVPPPQPPTHWHPQQPQPPFPAQPPQLSYHAPPPPIPTSPLPQQSINPPPSLDVTKIGDIVAMIKNNGTTPARDPESSNISTSDDREASKKPEHEASRAYRQVVLAETMILSTAEISRSVLVSRNSVQSTDRSLIGNGPAFRTFCMKNFHYNASSVQCDSRIH
jgi:pre-mRNA cleavage complex 2 protein Pcf11